MSHKYLSNVQESKTFLTSNEIQIKNIGELALVLKEHGNTIYTNHVNENTNDFANWVEHCIGDIELSNELRNSDNLDHTFEIIQNRILNIVSSTNLKAENMEKNNVKIPSNEKLAHMINGLPNSLKIDIQTNISTGQQNLIEPNIENNSLYTNIEFNTDDAGQVDFNIEEESTNITIQYTKINNEENNNN
ncbi:hypothetical protein HN451_09595, partial [archaeon]|nr:hypothetical protein [archaeon]